MSDLSKFVYCTCVDPLLCPVQGSMSSVIACLLSLQDHINFTNGNDRFQRTLTKCQSQPSNGWRRHFLEAKDVQQRDQTNGEQNSTVLGEERNPDNQELKSQGSMLGTVTPGMTYLLVPVQLERNVVDFSNRSGRLHTVMFLGILYLYLVKYNDARGSFS